MQAIRLMRRRYKCHVVVIHEQNVRVRDAKVVSTTPPENQMPIVEALDHPSFFPVLPDSNLAHAQVTETKMRCAASIRRWAVLPLPLSPQIVDDDPVDARNRGGDT